MTMLWAIYIIGAVVALTAVVGLLLRRVSSALHPMPRAYALSLVEPLYQLLCGDTPPDGHYLLSLTPNRLERVALAEVVASLSRSVVECKAEHIRCVAVAWGLEEALVWRIDHSWGHRRVVALEHLRWLHPSEECVRRVVRRTYTSPSAAFGQLLLVLYCVPERVWELVARHPYPLSWEEAGQVVEVLKMHYRSLVEPNRESFSSPRVDMLLLRLAAEEGVGDAVALARQLSTSEDRALRESALNILLEESLFPAMTQSEMECS